MTEQRGRYIPFMDPRLDDWIVEETPLGLCKAIHRDVLLNRLHLHFPELSDREMRERIKQMRQNRRDTIICGTPANGLWRAINQDEVRYFLDVELIPKRNDISKTISAVEQTATSLFHQAQPSLL